MIGSLLGGPQAVAALGAAIRDVAEVITPNATRGQELAAEAQRAALDQHGAEFAYPRLGWFDTFVNGLNRLPRPMLALGTLGLFIYAMADPEWAIPETNESNNLALLVEFPPRRYLPLLLR